MGKNLTISDSNAGHILFTAVLQKNDLTKIERRNTMKLSNKVYDVLKYIAQIVLPAVATLYFALAKIWGFPYATEITGTLAAVDAFLGALLQISTNNYNKNSQLQPPDEANG